MTTYDFDSDPAEHTTKEVIDFLTNTELTAEQFRSVIAREQDGRARKSILRVEFVDPSDDEWGLDSMETLSAEDMPKTKRGHQTKPNPFVEILQASYNEGSADEEGIVKGSARVLTVQNDKVSKLMNQIRNAANTLGIGSRIVLTDAQSGDRLNAKEDAASGWTKVHFQARTRRVHGEETEENTGTETDDATEYEYQEA